MRTPEGVIGLLLRAAMATAEDPTHYFHSGLDAETLKSRSDGVVLL